MTTAEPSAPAAVLDHVRARQNIVVPLANGEPVGLIDELEAAADRLDSVRVHQMHALHDRPYLAGTYPQLRHVAYFLSPVTRPCFAAGGCDFVPADFSEIPRLMARLDDPLVLAAASMPDRHGYVSLGTNADYVATLIGSCRFFVECNDRMPRTAGRGQIHLSQVEGWTVTSQELVEVPPREPTEIDKVIGALVAERIEDGSTIQVGIGAIPNAVMGDLADHHHLGVHTELLGDGLMDLIERGVITGVNKAINRNTAVATFALGTRRLYDFIDENLAVEFWPVDYVNDPAVIGSEPGFVSINAALEVDLLGQCASESKGSTLYSGSGGQADFARGAIRSEGGHGFIVLHAASSDGTRSRIRSQLTPGAVVTTSKNSVDKVVTQFGVAELHGRSVSDRAAALISVAHPDHRDDLTRDAHRLGYLHE